MKKVFILIFVCVSVNVLNAQYWSTNGNTVVNPNIHMLGTTDNSPIPFKTSDVHRMRLYPNQSATINGFTGIAQDGFVMLSRDPALFNTGPYSLLHLAGTTGGLQLAYRPWMVDGMTVTGNGDAMYMGLRSIQSDVTEAVINWGDNAGQDVFGPDNLVFRFTRAYNAGALDDLSESSMTGLQIMRLTGFDEGKVGIGRPFSTSNQPQRKLHVHDKGDNDVEDSQLRLSFQETDIYADFRVTSNGDLTITPLDDGTTRNLGIHTFSPTEKLDVQGNARFREIVSGAGDVLITGVEQSGLGDYALRYLEFNNDDQTYLAGDGTWQTALGLCDWDLVTNGTSDDLVMGYAGACNEGSVGIGTSNPDAELNIVNAVNGATDNTAEHIEIDGGSIMQGVRIDAIASQSTVDMFGVQVESYGISNSTGDHAGLRVRCSSGNRVYGVRADVGEVDEFQYGFGVYGRAVLGSTERGIGIYGEGNYRAGYFAGSLVSGQASLASDEMFKADISDIENALEIVGQLNPKTYEFKQDEFPEMNFQDGITCGLIAQEVQEVFPMAVIETQHPPTYNDEGELVKEAYDYLAVSYNDFIPVLIKATQEQQAIIDTKSIEIDELENTVQVLQSENSSMAASIETLNENVQMLAELIQSCCSIDVELKNADQGPNIQLLQDGSPVNELGQNFPNPFENNTTIAYQVACNCLATIRIMDHTGKTVDVLVNETKAAGNYQVEWNASNLASGMYYYSLEVDGQELVRKAIKL